MREKAFRKWNRGIGASLLCAALLAVSLSGCGSTEKSGSYDKESSTKTISSQVVASNENYELKWDDTAKCVLLCGKKTGEVWSDILYAAYQEGSTSANANSPISITVINESDLTQETVNSYTEIMEGGRVICEQQEDTLCVTYYFDRYEIAVPVTYQLREDSLAISVDGANIQEGDTAYSLVSVSVAPYFCNSANSGDGNYLFVPVGSGALMYTKENADGTRRYSGEVYGADAAQKILKSTADSEAIRLPVFGAKNGNLAMLGIIEEGAGSAFIEAQAGYARMGYSNVGATFYFRGRDTFRYGTYATGNSVTTRVSEERSRQKVTVGYYPLYEEEADYNGMAKRYRQYLLDQELLTAANMDASAYSVTLLGGTTIGRSFLGIPYDSLVSMTDFAKAKEILAELTEITKIAPVVQMKNYGDNGMRPGTLAGGSKYPASFGGKQEIEQLQEFCHDSGIPLFWDFDIVRYGKSGNGFSYNVSCAKTPIHYLAEQYPVTPLRTFDEDNAYHIIGRGKLEKAMAKALRKADAYQHTGISFSTLGEIAFSDYDDTAYAVKAGIDKDVAQLLRQAKDAGYCVASAGANSYAACGADVVFDVPLGYGDYHVIDAQIPFYQMVFHSYRPMYSTAVNLDENAKQAIMLAAASGSGVGFALSADYIHESNDLDTNKLYGTLYGDNAELIQQALNQNGFAEYYERTADSVITKYELLENGVSATYFENGVILYANHTSGKVESPAGELDAYMFTVR